ncbi:MAG: 5-(carboxyamino)imidazole ribonucleotide synthase [Bacilli bacterium]
MKIGVIGGGQLGMMMGQAAISKNHNIYSLDPSSDCPIIKYSSKHYQCELNDKRCIEDMCSNVDVVTYEFENINYNIISELEKKYDIFPASNLLYYSQNRYREKSFVTDLSIPTTKYNIIRSEQDLIECFKGNKCILKTVSGGYDSKGQVLIKDKLCNDSLELASKYECILEEFIEYDYETSIIATRSRGGDIVYFPLVINTHKKGILFSTYASKVIDNNLDNQARKYVKLIADKLNVCGTIALEFFVKNDRLIFNEMAPRPHNSGHHTIESCNVSQYDNHVNAITNKPLVTPNLLYYSLMYNIIGSEIYSNFEKYDGVFHNYGKTEVKSGRKMGHITFVANCKEKLEKKTKEYLEGIYGI